MSCCFGTGWRGVAVAGVLVVAGGLVACRMTPGCLPGLWPGHQSAVPVGPTEEGHNQGEPMSADTQTPRRIVHADEGTFEQQVLRSEVPVLVDFYADWCVPCQMLAPTLEELAREVGDAKIVKVNVDRSPDLAARYGIRSIPSLVVFKDGEVAREHVGLASKDQLRALIGG